MFNFTELWFGVIGPILHEQHQQEIQEQQRLYGNHCGAPDNWPHNDDALFSQEGQNNDFTDFGNDQSTNDFSNPIDTNPWDPSGNGCPF
jgi:hypothetical protein